MQSSRLRFGAYSLILATSASVAAVASAQVVGGASPPPVRAPMDENGVDLATGKLRTTIGNIATGDGSMALSLSMESDNQIVRHSFIGGLIQDPTGISVSLEGRSTHFTKSGANYVNDQGSGATLANTGGGTYRFVDHDGTVAEYFETVSQSTSVGSWPQTITIFSKPVATEKDAFAVLSKITRPNGEILDVNYDMYTFLKDESYTYTFFNIYRVSSVKGSSGYKAIFKYKFNGEWPSKDYMNVYKYNTIQLNEFLRDIQASLTMSSAQIVNLANDICDQDYNCQITQNPNKVDIAAPGFPMTAYTVTNNAGDATVYGIAYDGGQWRLKTIKRGVAASPDVSINYANDRVSSISKFGQTWNYGWALSGTTLTATITDPLSHVRVVKTDTSKATVLSDTNGLSQTTTYQYDSNGRLKYVIPPEGTIVSGTPTAGYTRYSYDGRGNVTEVRGVAKSGSALPDIVTTSSYPASCANVLTCNQPDWTRDANGNQIDYTYDDTHGGVLTVTLPAPSVGATRPKTTYSYATRQAFFKNYLGSIVASGVPTYVRTGTSTCLTGASCTGTADESKTVIDYGPQTAGTPSNLQPVSVTASDGTGALSATTSFTYDNLGNVVTVDGPLPGADDTTRNRYDSSFRLIGTVGPDPDGAGALPNAAQRVTYDSSGQISKVEAGTVAGQSDAAWSGFSSVTQVNTGYDAYGRKASETLTAGGTTYGVKQFSYDTEGRPDCVAVRMNDAAWSAQTPNCTPNVAGAAGPDRITKSSYDAAERETKIQTAYGTAAQSDEVATSYTVNGLVQSVTDAEGNKTSYEYDGFDRLSKTSYPSSAKGAGISSTTDYEQLGYDPAGNVLTRRLRDGQTISFGYDNLSRPVSKTTPGSAYLDWDVSYTYNLLGQLTGATGDGWAATSYAYDAFGRLTTEQNYNGTSYRGYDVAGRQTRLTWQDGFYVNYDYDVTGKVTAIRENGATSGIGVLATYGYDGLGRRTSVTRGNGTVTSYAYDPVSRLSSLTQNLGGTSYDFTNGFSYNPAGQIAARTASNDAYAWLGHYNVDRSYGTNGLNQLTSAGATALGYDGRGNLNNSGGSVFGYTTENRMASAPGSVSLVYEPAGGQLFGVTAGGVDTRFSWSGSQLIAELNGLTGATLRRYVPGPGIDEPLLWYEGAGTTDRRWLHADERGSIVAVSDASGNAIGINRYDEYGIPQSGNIGRFQYTGQAWMPEIGMYYYKARMYSPSLGRFMQTDPIGYGDGLNLQAYVGNDPINNVDPTGLAKSCGSKGPNDIVVCGNSGSSDADRLRVLAALNSYQSPTVSWGCTGILCQRSLQTKPPGRRVAQAAPQRTQTPTPCQAAFLKDQLRSRGLPTSQIDNLKFVSGLDSNANALTRNAFNGGASAVTQGSTVYVQPGSFNTVANFRSPTGFEEAYHTAQFASDSGFYSTYGILSIGGFLLGDSYNGNAYEAFAKGASKQMFAASKTKMCPK